MKQEIQKWAAGGLLGTLLSACAPQAAVSAPEPRLAPLPPPLPAAAPVAAAPLAIATLELSNPSPFQRLKDPVYLAYYDLGLAAADPRVNDLAARVGDQALPIQEVDEDGDGNKDGVLLLIDFGPAETRTLVLEAKPGAKVEAPKLTHAEISHKVGGEWKPRAANPKLQEYIGGVFQNVQQLTPPPEHTDHSNYIRYEGPGIESDLVGYRIYLDERNGFDIFGKRVTQPVLQQVGQDGFESYHQPSAWGMDILKVGLSLGTGGFGFWNGKTKKVELVAKVTGWNVTVVEEGNLRSSFDIRYKDWQIDGKTVDVNASFSMTGGSRLVHARLRTTEPLSNFAIGLVKHPATELLQGAKEMTGTAYNYVGSFGKQSLAGDLLGMGLLYQHSARKEQVEDVANYASVMDPGGKELEYYFLAAWEGDPAPIKSKEEFATYLSQEADKLTFPLRRRWVTETSEQAKSFPLDAQSSLMWAKRLADSELERKTLSYRHDGWDPNRKRKPRFEYDIVGLQPLAYDELNRVAADPRYAQVLEAVTGSYVTEQGKLLEYDEKEFNIDAINPGRNLLRLFEQTRLEKYKLAAAQLRRQLQKQPRTRQGAFWHKKKYPSQLWLDGVYMATPFLAQYTQQFEGGSSFSEVVNEFVVTREHLRNAETGLYFHGWDESRKQSWANPSNGLSAQYWGRGMGWYSMAVVDALDFIPEGNVAQRQPLLDIVKELAPALAKVQDATGTWWQVLDKAGETGNYRESSASAMFSYFFAKAVRKGYLDAAYQAVALRAFEGLVKEFVLVHPDGKVSMTNQCLVGGLGFGRDGSYRYYMSEPIFRNDPKGNGPFILAAVEVHRLLAAAPK